MGVRGEWLASSSFIEAGGTEAGPKHQPHSRMGGIVAEMLVSYNTYLREGQGL